ncbi:AraC family transcriptional regulator [Paenibacillus cremeus]|uniref:Helix-turn-helix domain-containing protein n=1 Tax=Paenibacillus cremeus TaxID=2163881 RepID=A0A559KBE8_9BACL|nr:AraC family transcriptional regulator [Paenibacillus cremeus]TVY09456.1 helix-turn-helix domain-containing protein [Paenibacillus cremeus]
MESVRFRYRRKSPSKPAPFHSHELYELYYFHEGKGNYLIGDKIYALQPGDLIVMNGMSLHCANIDPHYNHFRTTLHFDPYYTRELITSLQAVDVLKPFVELGNLRLHLGPGDRYEFEQMLLRLHTFYRQNDPIMDSRFLLAFLDLLHLVYRLCEQPLEQKSEFGSDKERHVQNIIAYVEQHYREEMTLEQMEKSLHLSKTYLSKIFKEVTGLTLFKYVYQRRINQAKVLFLLENRSVTDTCFQVGFKHLAHFSRIFKEHVGSTPEQFRKAANQRQ